jgi:aldehyde:ferredoxin oxidoreductase
MKPMATGKPVPTKTPAVPRMARPSTRPAGDVQPAYAGKLLRVNLSTGAVGTQPWGPAEMRTYLGGVGLGAKILYDEVGPDVHWDHPENRLVLATGPLAGLPVWGTGGLTVVTRGAMTDGATSTQANGFFGATLKFSGYDAIIIQGQAPTLSYLYINDDEVEIRDAAHLKGKDTWETQQALEQEHGLSGHRLSVYAIGPAGENLVRFAAIHGDYGHIASKNGVGAVMGKKRLKAVCIVRGTRALTAHDPRGVNQAADDIAHDLKTDPSTSTLYRWGTLPGVMNLSKLGVLPIKNYTTNLTGTDMSEWEPAKLRNGFDHRGHQCNACGMRHCHIQVIRSGPHAGELVDEPEYEGWSGAGWTLGITDKNAISWLNTRADRACVDINEFGWVCGWVMECMEKGYLTEEQVGFRLRFGDADGAWRLMQMITHRQGLGDLLAEGVKRAAEQIGGEAQKCAVYTMKGASPRGHDHRGRWEEMLDTCTASNGTMESANPTHQTEIGLPGRINPFDGEQVARLVGGILGRRHFEDSLGGCSFTFRSRIEYLARALSAATGWTYTLDEAMSFGRRTAAILRAFNLRSGIGPAVEYPSERYGSQPVDGPAKDHHVMKQWEHMLDVWYETVGYDRRTGKPTRQTLRKLGLHWLARDLWGRTKKVTGEPA